MHPSLGLGFIRFCRTAALVLPLLLLLCAVQTALLADELRAENISVQDAAALLAAPPAGLIILDVRTPEEFSRGRLPGAQNIDFFGARFEDEAAALPKDTPVLLYCRTGNRSAGAYEKLRKAGISKVLHMQEGITGWNAAGLTLEK